MLALKLLLVLSGCGLLAIVAMVLYDIYLSVELERLNRSGGAVASARRRAHEIPKCSTTDRSLRRVARR